MGGTNSSKFIRDFFPAPLSLVQILQSYYRTVYEARAIPLYPGPDCLALRGTVSTAIEYTIPAILKYILSKKSNEIPHIDN